MSRTLALDTLHCKSVPRLAHMEYSLEYHQDYIRRKTGLEPNHPDFLRKFYDTWGIDLLWGTDDGLHWDWQKLGRCTDMGHAEYAASGSDLRQPQTCPFKTPEEVWAFDPVQEYGLPDFDEQVAAYERAVQANRERWPNQLCLGGYYKTIVSGAIQAFGWDMLLEAATDRDKMERVLDGFFRFTLFHMEAWAQTSVEAVIQHDDFVWTAGPFVHPDFYRKAILPRYAELWKPLHRAGKKLIFCSDGDFRAFAGDVVAAGADGLIFEPVMDFSEMVERFGQSTVLIGSAVDCRDLTFGKWDQVRKGLDRTFDLAAKCKGLVLAVGNHLPPNVPEEMLEKYIGYLQAHWMR